MESSGSTRSLHLWSSPAVPQRTSSSTLAALGGRSSMTCHTGRPQGSSLKRLTTLSARTRFSSSRRTTTCGRWWQTVSRPAASLPSTPLIRSASLSRRLKRLPFTGILSSWGTSTKLVRLSLSFKFFVVKKLKESLKYRDEKFSILKLMNHPKSNKLIFVFTMCKYLPEISWSQNLALSFFCIAVCKYPYLRINHSLFLAHILPFFFCIRVCKYRLINNFLLHGNKKLQILSLIFSYTSARVLNLAIDFSLQNFASLNLAIDFDIHEVCKYPPKNHSQFKKSCPQFLCIAVCKCPPKNHSKVKNLTLNLIYLYFFWFHSNCSLFWYLVTLFIILEIIGKKLKKKTFGQNSSVPVGWYCKIF